MLFIHKLTWSSAKAASVWPCTAARCKAVRPLRSAAVASV